MTNIQTWMTTPLYMLPAFGECPGPHFAGVQAPSILKGLFIIHSGYHLLFFHRHRSLLKLIYK